VEHKEVPHVYVYSHASNIYRCKFCGKSVTTGQFTSGGYVEDSFCAVRQQQLYYAGEE